MNAVGLAHAVSAVAERKQDVPALREPMLQFFLYGHLPPRLQAVSRPFYELARQMVDTLPRNPERTAALRKLLESKDCAVCAVLYVAELSDT